MSEVKVKECPYPECKGTLAGTTSQSEPFLQFCPICRRPSGRCLHDACSGLNRPLAQYCRRCGRGLGPRWPDGVWGLDALGSRHRALSGEQAWLGPIEVVYDIESDPRLGAGFFDDLDMQTAAGRLWISGGGGQFLCIDPFGDPQSPSLASLEQLWTHHHGTGQRATVDGPWLVYGSRHGLRAIDLLERDGTTEPPFPVVFNVSPGSRIIGDLGLTRVEGDVTSRRAFWLVLSGREVQAATVRLVGLGGTGMVRVDPLRDQFGDAVFHDSSELSSPGIVAVPGQPGRFACASDRGVFLVDYPSGPTDEPPKVTRLGQAPRIESPFPGILAIDEDSGSIGGGARSVLLAACRDDRGPAVFAWDLNVPERPPLRSPDAVIPVGTVDLPGLRGAVCLGRDHLSVRRGTGDLALAFRSESLGSSHSVSIHGRLAISSGIEAHAGPRRGIVQVIDLLTRRMIGLETSGDPGPAPVMLGRYLFLVDRDPERGNGHRLIVRRTLSFSPVEDGEPMATGSNP